MVSVKRCAFCKSEIKNTSKIKLDGGIYFCQARCIRAFYDTKMHWVTRCLLKYQLHRKDKSNLTNMVKEIINAF